MRNLFFFITALTVILFGTAVMAEERPRSRVMIHGEVGSFNRGYEDLRYVDHARISFSTVMTNFGAEYRYRSVEGNVLGVGLVQTNIHSGKTYNFDRYVYQPLTLITLPYAFIGRDSHAFSFEIGVSWYFYFKRYDARYYYNTDGSMYMEDDEGMALNRRESHVFVNGMIRVLPEDFIHLKIRVSRERFNAADSIINLAAVLPIGAHTGEIYVSLLPPKNWFVNREGMLCSNQRLCLAWSYSLSFIRIGVETGVLINNRMGGEGSMGFINRLSGGLFTEISW